MANDSMLENSVSESLLRKTISLALISTVGHLGFAVTWWLRTADDVTKLGLFLYAMTVGSWLRPTMYFYGVFQAKRTLEQRTRLLQVVVAKRKAAGKK